MSSPLRLSSQGRCYYESSQLQEYFLVGLRPERRSMGRSGDMHTKGPKVVTKWGLITRDVGIHRKWATGGVFDQSRPIVGGATGKDLLD